MDSRATPKRTHVLFAVIFRQASADLLRFSKCYNCAFEGQKSKINPPRDKQTTRARCLPNDRQSVRTGAHLICLGIKRGRQLKNLRQQSIPPTICFHHLYEPNDYLQPAVSAERMNKFMRVLWTAWGASISSRVSHAWIWLIDSQMNQVVYSRLPLIQLQAATQRVWFWLSLLFMQWFFFFWSKRLINHLLLLQYLSIRFAEILHFSQSLVH